MVGFFCKTTVVRLFSSSATRSSRTLPFDHNALLDIHPEVKEAIHSKRPVVALESTIITHGMPFPKKLETAQSLENIVRSTGSVPATIGIIDGRVKIGLTFSELERLANTERTPPAVKVSRRDIGPALSMKRDGGTTCSATLIFAALAGIKVGTLNGFKDASRTHWIFTRFLQQEGTKFPLDVSVSV
jgi:pseudouridine-5'-phosphate glycosidase/pseudouridine kinase